MTVEAHHSTRQLLYLAKKEKNKRLAVRIQSVALAKQGFTCPKIVEMTGYSRRTIQRWVAQYNKAGIKGLIDKPRVGQPVILSVGLLSPYVDAKVMNIVLQQFSQQLSADIHTVLLWDQAGFHKSRQLCVPENITIL